MSHPVTDADLSVALDVLQERFSPVKPYPYEWRARLQGVVPVAGLWCGEFKAEGPMPGIDRLDRMGAFAERTFRELEAAPLRRLFAAYERWWERVTGKRVYAGANGTYMIIGPATLVSGGQAIASVSVFGMPDRASGEDLDQMAALRGLTRHGIPGEPDEESDASLRRRVLSYASLRVENPRPSAFYGDVDE